MNALNDSLSEISFPNSGRLAIGFERFDILAHKEPEFAHAVLDIFAGLERQFLLDGKRLLLMIQSNDPDIIFPAVGSTHVCWNPEEWLKEPLKNSQQMRNIFYNKV